LRGGGLGTDSKKMQAKQHSEAVLKLPQRKSALKVENREPKQPEYP